MYSVTYTTDLLAITIKFISQTSAMYFARNYVSKMNAIGYKAKATVAKNGCIFAWFNRPVRLE